MNDICSVLKKIDDSKLELFVCTMWRIKREINICYLIQIKSILYMSFGSISYNAIGSCESVSSDRIHNQTIYSCSKKQDETSQREKQKRVHIFEEITIE